MCGSCLDLCRTWPAQSGRCCRRGKFRDRAEFEVVLGVAQAAKPYTSPKPHSPKPALGCKQAFNANILVRMAAGWLREQLSQKKGSSPGFRALRFLWAQLRNLTCWSCQSPSVLVRFQAPQPRNPKPQTLNPQHMRNSPVIQRIFLLASLKPSR